MRVSRAASKKTLPAGVVCFRAATATKRSPIGTDDDVGPIHNAINGAMGASAGLVPRRAALSPFERQIVAALEFPETDHGQVHRRRGHLERVGEIVHLGLRARPGFYGGRAAPASTKLELDRE